MNPLYLSPVVKSSSIASVKDFLAIIYVIRGSRQVPSRVADRPMENVKSILDIAAERHRAECFVIYSKNNVAEVVSDRRLSYKELRN